MGLITLILLLAVTVLYVKDHLKTKQEALEKAAAVINSQIDNLARYGSVYAAIAFVLSLALVCSGVACLVKAVANLLIIAMLSPKLVEKYGDLILAKGGENAKKYAVLVAEQVKKNEKYVGYAGLVVSALLFAFIFN